ncbi:hypothetical protein G6L37_11810 [Agrobacterium rubi]|uniref:KAP family P-loop NTPase fold protein n=1 Tax=Agrobacterium rubi TaxID=28099 RepID=UPI001571867A|nr:P-loop NTPase fold protein [Agrobacterium rubi]NTF06847.1 hypothetical protein [Agrobacterium rubi]NTF19089.1 hypothetical protein [Agrobacterium rubi]NTF26052.1 hypothetical protein [Agrobacterium rubi]
MTESTNVWSDDQLDRKKHSAFVYALIRNRLDREANPGSFVVNIDARWGQGKSFFIERMYKDVLNAGHPAVFINAWKYDYIDDPYTHVISSIDEYLKSIIEGTPEQKNSFKLKLANGAKAVRHNASKVFWAGIKGGAKRASRWAIGEGTDEIIELVEQYTPEMGKSAATDVVGDVKSELVAVSDNIIDAFVQKRLDDFAETKKGLENFRDSFVGILELLAQEGEKKTPMFIFIDELDRCRPTYAIAMLERIKHLFDIPNVAFVIATDTTSLSHSIKAVYGSEFDSKQYLGRFFHRSYKLPLASNANHISEFLAFNNTMIDRLRLPGVEIGWSALASFIATTASFFDLSIREIEQSLRLLRDIVDATPANLQLETCYLYTLICEQTKEGYVDSKSFESIQSKLKPLKASWIYMDDHGKHEYYELFGKLKEIENEPVSKAFANYSMRYQSDMSSMTRYIHDLLKAEVEVATSAGVPFQISDYYALINHASNLNVDSFETFVQADQRKTKANIRPDGYGR